MKIAFSYNQICQIQIAQARETEIYGLVRSYLGFRESEVFTNEAFLDAISGDTFIKYPDEFGSICFSVRSHEFSLETVIHAFETNRAIEDIQRKLNNHIDHGYSLRDVRKAVSHAKTMIDSVEW